MECGKWNEELTAERQLQIKNYKLQINCNGAFPSPLAGEGARRRAGEGLPLVV